VIPAYSIGARGPYADTPLPLFTLFGVLLGAFFLQRFLGFLLGFFLFVETFAHDMLSGVEHKPDYHQPRAAGK
jgi:hypothetical protein